MKHTACTKQFKCYPVIHNGKLMRKYSLNPLIYFARWRTFPLVHEPKNVKYLMVPPIVLCMNFRLLLFDEILPASVQEKFAVELSWLCWAFKWFAYHSSYVTPGKRRVLCLFNKVEASRVILKKEIKSSFRFTVSTHQ